MSKPHLPAFALFVAVTASRRMTTAGYIAIASGLAALLVLTLAPAYEMAHRWLESVLWLCLCFFIFEWLVRLAHTIRAKHGLKYAISPQGVLDASSALGAPIALTAGLDPRSAWLISVIWLLKLVPGIPGLRQLRRVLLLESGPLLSVLALFVMVLFLASVVVHVLERNAQPAAFGSLPATLWWAVATLTTPGYGVVVPVTPFGRIVASVVMICGLAVFGLWPGFLATGFAAEPRRDNFLRTWESVRKVPFFAALGPAAI